MTHPRSHRRGVAAIELALTLPILLAMLVAIVELSRLMHEVHVVGRIARDACRVGAMVIEGVDPTGEDLRAAAEAQARLELEQAGLVCGLDCSVQTSWYEERDWMMLRVDIDLPYDSVFGPRTFVPTTAHGEFIMLTQQQLPPE